MSNDLDDCYDGCYDGAAAQSQGASILPFTLPMVLHFGFEIGYYFQTFYHYKLHHGFMELQVTLPSFRRHYCHFRLGQFSTIPGVYGITTSSFIITFSMDFGHYSLPFSPPPFPPSPPLYFTGKDPCTHELHTLMRPTFPCGAHSCLARRWEPMGRVVALSATSPRQQGLQHGDDQPDLQPPFHHCRRDDQTRSAFCTRGSVEACGVVGQIGVNGRENMERTKEQNRMS